MSQDTISNMLSTVKNASMVGKASVELPYSKSKEEILKVLKKGKFIENVKAFKDKGVSYKMLRVDLAYMEDGSPVIKELKRVSKPGRRMYLKNDELRKMDPRYMLCVVSTPKGVMSSEEAREKKLGGEVICEARNV